jgi:hypothetical protein
VFGQFLLCDLHVSGDPSLPQGVQVRPHAWLSCIHGRQHAPPHLQNKTFLTRSRPCTTLCCGASTSSKWTKLSTWPHRQRIGGEGRGCPPI